MRPQKSQFEVHYRLLLAKKRMTSCLINDGRLLNNRPRRRLIGKPLVPLQ
jgi:hypothetical protein